MVTRPDKIRSRSRGSAYFFTAAQFVKSRPVAGEVARPPMSVMHAKEMGTLQTACGVPALTWAKLWDQPFETVRGERCPRCVAILVERFRLAQSKRV